MLRICYITGIRLTSLVKGLPDGRPPDHRHPVGERQRYFESQGSFPGIKVNDRFIPTGRFPAQAFLGKLPVEAVRQAAPFFLAVAVGVLAVIEQREDAPFVNHTVLLAEWR